MTARSRWHYYRRIFKSYLGGGQSQLTFWHERPEVNTNSTVDRLGEYYQAFFSKADYNAHLDSAGVPLLDYHGTIGRQYNPIAIAQYGLGNYNLWRRTEEEDRRRRLMIVADWLVANLQENADGLFVWHHYFDWEYRETLKAPWYSGLAQGQGISVLVRAFDVTSEKKYLDAAEAAFEPILHQVDAGGVSYVDEADDLWIEEYIVSSPTHILNGFLWALWGVWDFYLVTQNPEAKNVWDRSVQTLEKNLPRYDAGFWSLYELSDTRLKMMASPFYHSLHIVQLEVMYRLTGADIFRRYHERWSAYRESRVKKSMALAYKVAFKLAYY